MINQVADKSVHAYGQSICQIYDVAHASGFFLYMVIALSTGAKVIVIRLNFSSFV